MRIGVPFVKFGAEVKQYGVDAAAAILLTLVAIEVRERSVSLRRLVAGRCARFAGPVVPAGRRRRDGRHRAGGVDWLLSRNANARRMLLVTIPLWALASILGLLAGLRSLTPATREFMHDFLATGFFPRPMTSAVQLRWYGISSSRSLPIRRCCATDGLPDATVERFDLSDPAGLTAPGAEPFPRLSDAERSASWMPSLVGTGREHRRRASPVGTARRKRAHGHLTNRINKLRLCWMSPFLRLRTAEEQDVAVGVLHLEAAQPVIIIHERDEKLDAARREFRR